MAINQALLDQIRLTLGSAISPSLSTASDTSDIFEAYIFSLILDAAATERAAISFRDVVGNVPTRFIFRTSPGLIHSRRHAYSHAVIEFPDTPPLEVHLGVRIVGKSGVLHECDVAVIDLNEAETCRRNIVSPRTLKVLIAVECKFYSTNLQLHLARAFIGLTSDFSSTTLPVFVTNSQSNSVEKLLAERGKKWENNLIPTQPVEVLRLRHVFQEEFKSYKKRFSSPN